MRKIRYIAILLVLTGMAILYNSCEKEEDYSHLIYKNYLTYEINRATNFLNTTTEGSNEGEYKAGSKQAYQNVVDAARQVDENTSSSQEKIDDAYASLLQSDEDFFDQMIPFRSEFQVWIDYSEIILANTEEGNQEGNVKTGSKSILQDAIDAAKNIIARENLTQRLNEQATTDLTNSVYAFNGEIIGSAATTVINPGFEKPGYETTDFGEVEGWTSFGKVEEWAPKASVSPHDEAPEGQFIAKTGSYTQGIYQNVFELIHPNSEYTLSFRVSLLSNNPDWQGKKYPAIMHARLMVFEEEEGDYDFATVISESYDTLGIEPEGFIEINLTASIDAISDAIGKKMAIDFEQRHTWNIEEQIWAESFVAIDDIKLYRKL